VFYDEFGFSFLEALGPTWAPRGQRPILRRVTRERRVLTTAAGLVWSGKIYKRYFSKGMDSLDVMAAWKHLLRYLPKGFILICDQAPIHTSKAALCFLWAHPEIVVEPLETLARLPGQRVKTARVWYTLGLARCVRRLYYARAQSESPRPIQS